MYKTETQISIKINNMLLLSISEFRANVSKYLQMSLTENISIRSKSGIFNITPNTEIRTTNPSPSNDPWFEVPENVAELNRRIKSLENCNLSKLQSWEEVRKELNL